MRRSRISHIALGGLGDRMRSRTGGVRDNMEMVHADWHGHGSIGQAWGETTIVSACLTLARSMGMIYAGCKCSGGDAGGRNARNSA